MHSRRTHLNTLPLATAFLGLSLAGTVHADTDLITNGDFGTGDLTGWTIDIDSANPASNFYIDTSGTPTPASGTPTIGGGSNYAVSDGPATKALSQTFTVPVDFDPVTDTFSIVFDAFANNWTGAPAVVSPLGLSPTGAPNQHARIDLLDPALASSDPFNTTGAVISNFYLGSDPTPNPNPFSGYAIDLTDQVSAGSSYTLRFAAANNAAALNLGVDNVQAIVAEGAPTLASTTRNIGSGSDDWFSGTAWSDGEPTGSVQARILDTDVLIEFPDAVAGQVLVANTSGVQTLLTLTDTGGGASLNVGLDAKIDGTSGLSALTVGGNTQMGVGRSLEVGDAADDASDDGLNAVTIDPSGLLSIQGQTTVWSRVLPTAGGTPVGNELTVRGGLVADLLVLSQGESVTSWPGGASGELEGIHAGLYGDGTITADVTIEHGILGTRQSSASSSGDEVLAIVGELNITGHAELEIGLATGPAPTSQRLEVYGGITIENGAYALLLIDDLGGTTPFTKGMMFDILDFNNFSGTFDEVFLPDLGDPTLSWDLSSLYTTGEIAVIPEPASASLLIAFGWVLARRSKRLA